MIHHDGFTFTSLNFKLFPPLAFVLTQASLLTQNGPSFVKSGLISFSPTLSKALL